VPTSRARPRFPGPAARVSPTCTVPRRSAGARRARVFLRRRVAQSMLPDEPMTRHGEWPRVVERAPLSGRRRLWRPGRARREAFSHALRPESATRLPAARRGFFASQHCSDENGPQEPSAWFFRLMSSAAPLQCTQAEPARHLTQMQPLRLHRGTVRKTMSARCNSSRARKPARRRTRLRSFCARGDLPLASRRRQARISEAARARAHAARADEAKA